ncbi:MAG: preprotein translocase subunit SecG [Candidatus Pacebacteria bacterium]|nr:preprotein translocase subunit SecG [Candidatus Paceibacterota bacterium]
MNTVAQILPVLQLILALLLIALILLQRAGEGMDGGALGGGSSNVTYFARRGGERFLFLATITVAVLFAISAIAAILI